MYYIATKSGKRHLSPNLYVAGRVGSVPRTLCPSLIKQCTNPVYVKGDPLKVPDLCEVCARTYKVGKHIYDNIDDLSVKRSIEITYEVQ